MVGRDPGRIGGERIDVDRAFDLYQQRQATLVDVRDRTDFEVGHIPGALSIPLTELGRKLDEIPRERTVITYCT